MGSGVKTQSGVENKHSDTALTKHGDKSVAQPESAPVSQDKKAPNADDGVIEKPEFPPVLKMINEQLQKSGKRTALKSESQFIAEHQHELNDEQLAESFKRILDEQARRHGINV